MSRSVRSKLGFGLNPEQNERPNHERYQADLAHIASAMLLGGYRDICSLGPEGSNSHALALDIASALGMGCSDAPDHILTGSMQQVLEETARQESLHKRVGVLPIVNTVGGMVRYNNHPDMKQHTNLKEILKRRMRVLGIAHFAVTHSLLVHPTEATLALNGREVYSHPQALSQCSHYIDALGLIPREAASTSAAARDIANGTLPLGALAISSQVAADIYGLSLVANDVGDIGSDQNITVMAIVAESNH